jgi:hypothetical protein
MKYRKVVVKYHKLNQTSGKLEKVNESFLIDAVTNTEAEAKAIEKLTDQISGEFDVKGINESKIDSVYRYADGGLLWLLKVSFIDVNDEGKEKKVTLSVLVEAQIIEDAIARLHENFKAMIIPYTIVSCADSKIIDVFEHENTAQND